MTDVIAKVKEEFLAVLPPTIFFFIALHLVAFVRVLINKGTGLAPLSTISIAVAALILGKAVLIADMLPIINRYPEQPLIQSLEIMDSQRPRIRGYEGAARLPMGRHNHDGLRPFHPFA